MADNSDNRKRYRSYLEPCNSCDTIPRSSKHRWQASQGTSENIEDGLQTSARAALLVSGSEANCASLLFESVPSTSVTREENNSNTEEPLQFTNFYHEDAEQDNLDGNESVSSAGLDSSEADYPSSSGDDDPSDPSDATSEEGQSDSDEGEVDEGDGFDMNETLNEPLCAGVGTTRAEALLMIMSFVMRYALSSAALVGMLKLINEMFGRQVLVATRYLCQKIFKNKSLNFVFHFYCQHCFSLVCSYQHARPQSVPCPQCQRPCLVKNLLNGNFFVTTNLKAQFKSLFETPDIAQSLSYRHTRNKIKQHGIEDIYDGEIYKNMCQPGQPLHDGNNFSYSFNSDGMPVFKSSKYSLWPIYLMLNELSPRLRKKNLILAGVWFGKTEPKMNIFLNEFVSEANTLITEGVLWNDNGRVVRSRLYGISCNVDAPARASMQNTVQFNGYMGCGLCYHPGVNVERTVKYPVNVCDYTERTDDEMLQDMVTATDEGRIVRGVKGPSALINIPYFPIVWGFPVDFMHCVLLGVTRQLTDLWFESPATSSFYIGSANNVACLDNLLRKVKLPSFIPRTQRPLSERKFWKASEWYTWLLFIALPCVVGILPNEYFTHFCTLIEAIFLLLQKSISEADVNKADILLYSFVANMQVLYGSASMTFNVHSLTHLARGVQLWGPLWTHSCFPFEVANGKIKALLHGNRGIIMQTLHKFVMVKTLRTFKFTYRISVQKREFCENVLFASKCVPSQVMGEVQLHGAGQLVNLSPQEIAAIQSSDFIVDNVVLTFNRMSIKGFSFHTVYYQKSKTRNNNFFFTEEGIVGELQRVICTANNECIILYKEIHFAAAIPFTHEEVGCEVSHIKKCIDNPVNMHVDLASAVAGGCIFIKLRNHSYICFPPNFVTL